MFYSSITGHLCPLWAVDGHPHSDAFFTFAPPGQAFCPPPPPRAIDGCPPSDAILKSCSSITGKVAPRGPLMGVLAAMQFCPLWVRSVVVLPVRQPCSLRAFFLFLLVSCPPCKAAMPPAGLSSDHIVFIRSKILPFALLAYFSHEEILDNFVKVYPRYF